jgi:hypothetical protein
MRWPVLLRAEASPVEIISGHQGRTKRQGRTSIVRLEDRRLERARSGRPAGASATLLVAMRRNARERSNRRRLTMHIARLAAPARFLTEPPAEGMVR